MMATLENFLRGLFDEGRAVLVGRPGRSAGDASKALSVLEPAFGAHKLDVAGPSIVFDPASALAASELVWRACWLLLHRDDATGPRPRMPGSSPRSASAHLSADLVLRFLPQVHRRARSGGPGDRLATELENVLRDWPLSGVLGESEAGPSDPEALDFAGHPGLQLLYAERLARGEKPGWMPRSGPAREQVERVLIGLGRARSPLLANPTEVALA